MSYTAIGSGSITLNVVSAEEQKNLQETLMNRYDRLRTADLAQCGDDMAYEDRARDLLKAFEAHDPDGVLLALSGRRLHEHGVAAGIWQDGGESAHPDEGE